MEVVLTLLLVFVGSILAFVTRWVLRRRKKLNLFKKLNIPGPEPQFLTGNLSQLGEGTSPNDVITNWLNEFGPVFGYFVGEVPYIVIKDLELLKQVFVKDFHVFTNRPECPLNSTKNSNHLVHLEGRRWKEIRSILTPTFTSAKIKLMMEKVNRKVDDTLTVVREKAETGEMFDIYPVVQALTLDVIADCAFAMKTNCQNNPNDNLLTAIRNSFHPRKNPALQMSIMFPFLAPLMLVLNRHLLTSGRMLSFIVEHLKVVIESRRKNPASNCNDFLQLVIDANQVDSKIKMSDVDIMSNALQFLMAGYETTSTALAFTFHLLTTHPDIQEKLFQEIAQAEDCTYETIQGLCYLDQVFSESLRIYPPVTGFLSRTCSQDHQVGSIVVPKGTKVLAPVWDIHHDPDLWQEPWKFDPNRFSSDNKPSIHGMAYLPFGAGPRNCIGSRFAQMEAKLAVFKLVKEFKFHVCEKTEKTLQLKCPNLITKPANGIYLRAVSRNV